MKRLESLRQRGIRLSQPIIFVGGIHGAGKTTMSRPLAARLSATHVTAGALIRETAGSETVTVGVGDKAVPDVDTNQALLLRGLDVYRRRVAGPIVLDGHFSLLSPSGDVVAIPPAVYLAIAPTAIILVEADSQVVRDRLAERDGAAPPLTTVLLLAERERAAAEAACAALDVPMLVVRGDGMPDEAAQTAASRLRPLLSGAT